MTQNKTKLLPETDDTTPCDRPCHALKSLLQIYHSAPLMIATISGDGKVLRLNRRLRDFAGLSEEQCSETTLCVIFPQLKNVMTEIVNAVVETRKPTLDQEYNFTRHEQQLCWVINAYPVVNRHNKTEAANIFINDISELRHMQQQLQQAYQDISTLRDKLNRENLILKSEVEHSTEGHILGTSSAIKKLLVQTQKVAGTDATVMISGDTGTGKELLAREVHRLSRRSELPLVTVNCAAMPANLIESELFGHEKGSFTGAISRKIGKFEIADKGTIFLDEIGELPIELQSKLLRVLQESQFERIGGTQSVNVNVRIIAATNRDLSREVKAGKFREDLYFRLNVFPLHLPPLSQRGEDIILIAENYLHQCCRNLGKNIKSISDKSKQKLLNYSWPGNIRELRNLIERAAILCQTDTLEISPTNNLSKQPSTKGVQEFPPSMTLEEVQKLHILKILELTGWRIRGERGAARILGLKPTTLESRMAKLGIKRAHLKLMLRPNQNDI